MFKPLQAIVASTPHLCLTRERNGYLCVIRNDGGMVLAYGFAPVEVGYSPELAKRDATKRALAQI